MNARSRTSLVAIAGAALWAAISVAACGAADGVDHGPGTDDTSGTGGMGTSGDVQDPDNTPNGVNEGADAGGANTNSGAAGNANTGAAGSTNTGPAGAGARTGSADAGHVGQFSGASCPDNAPMSGFCISFGDQCTYTTSTETHFCTCLASAPATPGTQGWSCR